MEKGDYKAMLFAVTIFVGGMITVLILSKYLKEPALDRPLLPTPKEPPMLSPIDVPAKSPSKAYNKQVSVTEQITELYHQKDGLPWMRFGLYNAGPDPVYACVNTWLWPEAPIQVGQTVSYDFGEPGSIKKVYFKCDAGQQATVNLNIIE